MGVMIVALAALPEETEVSVDVLSGSGRGGSADVAGNRTRPVTSR